MIDKTYMEKLEDVIESMGLKTFESPLTLNYRFGEFEPEMGIFRCFVNENDYRLQGDFLEIVGLNVHWVALEYPGYDEMFENILEVSHKCCKVLGRMHTASFYLALEEGLPNGDEEKLKADFKKYLNSLLAGTYQNIEVWDAKRVDELHQKYIPVKQTSD